MALSMEELIVQTIAQNRDFIRQLVAQETPFENGILTIEAGGTASTTAADARSALGTNDASNITTGTLAAARLGASPSAAKLLFGDSTWSTLSSSDIPNLDASKVTSGILGPARLGSGSPSSSNFLRGDGSWATPVSDVSGSGATNQVAHWNGTSTLTGSSNFTYNGTTLAVPYLSISGGSGGIDLNERDGSGLFSLYATGSAFRVWDGAGDVFRVDTNGRIQTGSAVTWDLGGWTTNGDAAINGYCLVNVAGTNRKLATIA